jgi:hypothetical protein
MLSGVESFFGWDDGLRKTGILADAYGILRASG